MNRNISLLLLVLVGCHGSHTHDDPDESGHGHGEGAVSFTAWGQHSELFGEYTPLVVGSASETAIHVTHLADFSAVTAGTITIELAQTGESVVKATAKAPARPGIFTPALTPTVAGACKLTFVVQTEAWTERIAVPDCQVHETKPATAHDEEAGGTISFLKEQQWKTEFGTAEVGERALRKTIRVNGEIKPVTGRAAHLTAALTGRVQFAKDLPVLGMPVKKGQLLARVTPPLTGFTNRASLQADIASARAEHGAAQADQERVARLAKEGAIAGRRIKEAEARAQIATSRVNAARERMREYDASASGRGGGGNAFRVRSPIAGTLVKVEVTSGETVEAGRHLFTVIDVTNVWVEGRVFEPDIPAVIAADSASFTVEGYDKPFVVDDSGRRITVGQVLDPHSRTVPVIFEVQNPNSVLRIGQFAELEISTGEPQPQLAVPATAVLTDGGRSVVFVQREGESFERRFIEVGHKSEGWVAIESGLQAGERVVSRGAHTVKLAGAAGSTPGHGHAH